MAFPKVVKTITNKFSEHYIYHPETGKFMGEYTVTIPF
jgi:hypothetical protein